MTNFICFHWVDSLCAFLKVTVPPPPPPPRHPQLCKPCLRFEVCVQLLTYSTFIWSSPVFSSPNSIQPAPSISSTHPLAFVDKAISLIDDWAAFSDPGGGGRRARDLMKKEKEKVMLHNGGRAAVLANMRSPPNLRQIQEPLSSDLVSGIKVDL